jgi:hypothetical protein
MLERIEQHPAHEAEHAHRAVAPVEEIDAERGVALARKPARDVLDVLVEALEQKAICINIKQM